MHEPAPQDRATLVATRSRRFRNEAGMVTILTVVGSLLLLGMAVVWWLLIQRGLAHAHASAESDLASVVDLQARQIETWLKEREGDGAMVQASNRVAALLVTPGDPAARATVSTYFQTLRSAHDFSRIVMYDAQGALLLDDAADGRQPPACAAGHVRDALRMSAVTLSDLHRESAGDPLHLTVMVPLSHDTPGRDGTARGVVLLIIEPARFLFPFLSRWPVPSPTAETMLVRRDGDEVEALNESGYHAAGTTPPRLRATDTASPIVRAALGERQSMIGADSRGVRVLAIGTPVRGTAWTLVAKMDLAEAEAPAHEAARWTALAVGFVLLTAGVALVLFFRQRTLTARVALQDRELQLQSSRLFLDSIVDQSPLSMWIADARGTLIRLNRACCETMRVQPDEVVGKYNLFEDAVLAAQGLVPLVRSVFDEGRGVNFDLTYDTAAVDSLSLGETTTRHLNVTIFPVRDATGRITNAVVQHIDATERKRAEEALRESQEMLRQVIAAALDGIVMIDPQGCVSLWNAAAERMLGFTRDDVIGKELHHVLVPERYQAAADAGLPGFRRDGRGMAIDQLNELMARHKDGREIPVEVSVAPLRLRDAWHAVGIIRDITARKRAEDDLKARNEELMRFTYTVSHDLKSPLVTIQTFVGYLEKDIVKGDAERIETDIGYVRRAASKMLMLLDELLELSRVGRKMNPPEDVPFETLVRAALDAVAGQITDRGVRVQVDSVPVALHGDRRRLTEVFQNLIDNAVKFMGDQRDPVIEIGADLSGQQPVFFVRDNGLGVDARHAHKLFGLFEKLHPDLPGSGMGLALIKRIIEVHGGRIWFESAGPMQGTTFLFTVQGTRPAQRAE